MILTVKGTPSFRLDSRFVVLSCIFCSPGCAADNAVIDAHARSGGGRASAERAEALLAELESRAKAGDASLRPTTRTYNAAILAWKNCGGEPDAALRAEALLRRMNDAHKGGDEGCRPDRVTLNSIIGVWAASASENSAERAEQFLTFMERSAARGDASLKPDAFTYNSCIAAHTRRNSPRQALRLYERMKARRESGGGGGTGEHDVDDEVNGAWPDSITHMMIRRALASSRDAIDPLEASRIEREISRYGDEATAL
jgi:pentatricopeptide repeat protein